MVPGFEHTLAVLALSPDQTFPQHLGTVVGPGVILHYDIDVSDPHAMRGFDELTSSSAVRYGLGMFSVSV